MTAAVARVRRGIPLRLYLGNRRILAMTCIKCGLLKQGSEFKKRPCKNGWYVDRRCGVCRWRHMADSPGR